MKIYDCIIIGAGSGGLNVASFMNSIGLSVLLIDRSDEHIGGDCLNTGCVPSKALIHVARTVQHSVEAEQFGLLSKGSLDMEKVMAYVRGTQAVIRTHENAEYFRAKGMTVVFGEASLAGPCTVKVEDTLYTGKRIIIATGSRPRMLTIPGTPEVERAGRMHTNETIFSLKTLPKQLLVVGGGPIGIELGQAFRYLGSQVTIISNDSRILPREDAHITSVLEKRLIQEGIVFHYNVTPSRFEGGQTLIIQDQTTHREEVIDFDAVLVSIGRVPNSESLNLEAGGVEKDSAGRIKVDPYLRTTNKNIFVCGDVAGQHQFTHAAELHARLIIRNMFTPFFKQKLHTHALSWVTYTTPEVATYGQNEADLKSCGVRYEVIESTFEDDDRAITDGARYGYAKMYVDKKSHTILGGTMVAPHAGELIQELILAVGSKLTVSALFNKIYPYPTAARINSTMARIPMRERLTAKSKGILRWLYRCAR